MTAMPEAAIAREERLDYACIAMIVNHAAGRGDVPIHDDVAINTAATKSATMSVLRNFFEALN
jgi:purine nucleoside phosphorylase